MDGEVLYQKLWLEECSEKLREKSENGEEVTFKDVLEVLGYGRS